MSLYMIGDNPPGQMYYAGEDQSLPYIVEGKWFLSGKKHRFWHLDGMVWRKSRWYGGKKYAVQAGADYEIKCDKAMRNVISTMGEQCREIQRRVLEAYEEEEQKQKEETMQFENGKIYQVKSPETSNIYPAFWSSDRERFIVLQLVAGGEVNTFELEKGCVVEG